MSKQTYETSRFERLSYGGFFLGQNIIYVIQFQFLSYFYTEEVGLSLASTTLMLLIARIWDIINDPIVGAIVDKSHFKSGKYLPWLRFVTYTVPLTMVFVFFNLGASVDGGIKLAFAYITYILWGMLYTCSDSPLFSLGTVMSSKVYERDLLISYGRFAAALAAILSAVFMSLKTQVGWTWTAAIYMIFSFLVMFPLQFTAKERVQYKRSEHIPFSKIFKYLLKNKYLLIYYVGYLAIGMVNTLQPIAPYFCNSNLGNEGMLTIVMGLSVIPVLLAAPLLPMLISRFGKKNLTIYTSLGAIVLSIVQYFMGYGNFVLFLVITAIRVLCMQFPLLIYGMFTADCIEYGAYVTGERTEAIAFSVQTLVTKMGGTICNTICLQLLVFFGYVQQSPTQTPEALGGIWKILTLLPAAGFGVMIIIMLFFYKLSEEDVQKIMRINRGESNEKVNV
ncbi:MFS transporter [Acetanaerobacterium elongatum]|uniref:Probable glucitol transport protein GutA n=1 Tax=Acetanaerobacterium elongatum TaxID=258515 RepID=A0A1H0BYD7_9FIRM|nr:glycoside-pentoside-hexuronide (GPH):cation symporter [Acetanaerobacterium elongatum]SDN50701.1 probable glucitol transport protein GutA [Acetanaerobacterium elongatum]